MANGSQVSLLGVVNVHFLPFLSINNVIYVPSLHLTYYLLVVSFIPLIVLSPLQKIMYVYMTRFWVK